MSHNLDGTTPWGRARAAGFTHDQVAENAHAGPYVNAEQAVRGYDERTGKGYGWMYSDGHRGNILNSNHTLVGVGVAYSTTGVPYYVMKLAQPR